MPKNQKSMTNSLHPPAALRLRVLHSQGKAPTVCSVFPMKLPGSSFFPMDLRYAAASISATAPPLCSHSSTAPPLSSRSATAPPLCSRSATEPRPATPPQRPCQQQLCHGVPASNSSATASPPATALPRRPRQQQTSSVGEKYSGLASNLAHLGRIC